MVGVKCMKYFIIVSQAHEILALEILTLLVENPTDDSVEVAIAFLKECGDKLTEVSSKALHSIFEMLRNILHEGALDKRVSYPFITVALQYDLLHCERKVSTYLNYFNLGNFYVVFIQVQYMIEVMFQVRKDGFSNHKAVEEGLDVVEEEDQFTHLITLDEATDPQDVLSK